MTPTDAALTRTGFDVDLHEVKAGETYQTISKLHYGDAKYAEALRAFNRSGDLARIRDVEIPPMYVLRQKYGQYLGAVRTAGEVSREPSREPSRTGTGTGTVEWAATPATATTTRTYTTPREGMTLRDVAADELGSAREWERVWNLNLQLRPDDKLAAGTILKLPGK